MQVSVVEHQQFWGLQGRCSCGSDPWSPTGTCWPGHSGSLPRNSAEGHTGTQTNRKFLDFSVTH